MKRKSLFLVFSLALLCSLAFGQETAAKAPATPEEAMWRTGGLLATGIGAVPTPEVVESFRTLRTALEGSGDAALEPVAVAIADVEAALVAEPFEEAVLVEALEALALAMRAAAGEGDASFLVELASLVDQTAALIEDGGYTPRMEVEVP